MTIASWLLAYWAVGGSAIAGCALVSGCDGIDTAQHGWWSRFGCALVCTALWPVTCVFVALAFWWWA